jgi:hypothetical protein
MTRRRHDVVASLADRGRPELWATEDEAAALSGVGPERFREKVEELEAKGFPKIHPFNGKRFIPAMVEFWAIEQRNPSIFSKDGGGPRGEQRETWGSHDRNRARQRISA